MTCEVDRWGLSTTRRENQYLLVDPCRKTIRESNTRPSTIAKKSIGGLGLEGRKVVMRIAHIVNSVSAELGSDLRIAQPVTFESMQVAANYASPLIHVDLISAQFPEDRAGVPPFITLTRDLDRSASDVGTFAVPRKLPLLADILERLGEASPKADFYVYTNVDIALLPHFYVSIAALVQENDALVINRRTISADFNRLDQLPLMYAKVGKPHPGFDCFVFRANLLDSLELGTSLIGAPWVGNIMLCNLVSHAQSFALFKDLHLTFHIGNDRIWRRPKLNDYRAHNRRELSQILEGWHSLGIATNNADIQRVHQRVLAEESQQPPHRLTDAIRQLARGARNWARQRI